MRPLEIPIPTEKQLETLEEVYQTTRDVRLHTRVQIVFLAVEQHLNAAAIAAIVRTNEETVRRWLKRWCTEGMEGLRDRPGGGAPAKSRRNMKSSCSLVSGSARGAWDNRIRCGRYDG